MHVVRVIRAHSSTTPLLPALLALLCVLCAYFVLLPLRETYVLSALGTDRLPSLFTGSLLVTLCVSPVASALTAAQPIGRGHQVILTLFAATLTGLYALVSFALSRERQHGVRTSSGSRGHCTGVLSCGVPAVLYITVNLMQLVASSTIWSLCAYTFTSHAAKECYGLLSAGATTGQLLGSSLTLLLVATHEASGDQHGAGNSAAAAASAAPLLLLSAGLMLVAARCARSMACRGKAARQPATGANSDPAAPDAAEGGAADDGPQVLLPAGHSTSIAAATGLPSTGSSSGGSGQAGGPSEWRLGQGQLLSHRSSAATTISMGAPSPSSGNSPNSAPTAPLGGWHSKEGAAPRLKERRGAAVGQHLHTLASCITCIIKSPYLQLVCAYIALSSVTSSMVYFERSLVVSHAHSGTRLMAFLARLNSLTAAIILALQLSATALLIRHLGVAWCLLASPALSMCGLLLIAWLPAPAVVAGVEVARKVVQYSFAKPVREVLFTALTLEELPAKVVIDSLAGRTGDTLAAAIFHALHVDLRFSPSSLGVVAAAAAGCWLLLARQLGARFNRRQQQLLQ